MAERIWNVASYARLSREDGDKEESNSIGSQREMIREFVGRQPDMAVAREYADDGYSGVSFDRPGFRQMMDDIREGVVDCVCCKDLSRFARNYIDSGRYLEKVFPSMGVRFVAINDGYDSRGERSQSDSLVIPFKNLINDAYCKDISMKIRSQLDIKRKMGDFIGAFCPYGYKRSPEDRNRLVADGEAAGVVEEIFRLRLRGMSNSGIAERLNGMGVPSPMAYKESKGENYRSGFRRNGRASWSSATIRRVLSNPVYAGTMVQHKRGTPNYKVRREVSYDESEWIVVPDSHEAIISREDFDTVQSLLERDVRVAPGRDTACLFSGFAFCGGCGRPMSRKTVASGGRKYRYLVCSSNKAGRGCSPHCFSEEKLERVVLGLVQCHVGEICEVGRVMEYMASLPESGREAAGYDAQIARLEADLRRNRDLKLNLYGDMASGVISREEYAEFRAGYDRRIAEGERSLEAVRAERERAVRGGPEEAPWVREFKKFENIGELGRPVLTSLVDRIVIHGADRVEVVFRYEDEFRGAMEYIGRLDAAGREQENAKEKEQDVHGD